MPKEGALIWTDNMCIPAHAPHPRDAMTYMDCVYQPEDRSALIADYINYITPVPATQAIFKKRGRAGHRRRQGLLRRPRDQPADVPERRPTSPSCTATASSTKAEREVWNDHLRADLSVMSGRLRAQLAPYWLVLPGWLWLVIFFVVPAVVMLSVSTMTGDLATASSRPSPGSTYRDAWSNYHMQFMRSLIYGLIATVLCMLIGYPVAYWIAFRGGAHKSSLLFLLLLPFFVSFVIRTQSWNFMLVRQRHGALASEGLGLVPADFHILQTPVAVIGGLVYNFLPFMVLPIYVALERVDPALLEAAADLYASKVSAFLQGRLPAVAAGRVRRRPADLRAGGRPTT